MTSTDRCNTSVKPFCRGFKLQRFARPLVELTRHFIQMRLAVHRQIGALGKVLPEQAVGILVGAALPRALRVAEVNVDVGCQAKPAVIGKLLATVPGQRFV